MTGHSETYLFSLVCVAVLNQRPFVREQGPLCITIGKSQLTECFYSSTSTARCVLSGRLLQVSFMSQALQLNVYSYQINYLNLSA